jgi:hypothetical protein
MVRPKKDGKKKPIRSPAEQKGDFLAALIRCGGNIGRACEMSDVPKMNVYRWRKESDEFAKAWDEAAERGTDTLEDEAIRRAFDGVDRPVFQGGREVGRIREYSDTLLIFLLKGRRPAKYREQHKHEHSGPNGGEIPYKVYVGFDPTEV